MLGSRTPRAMRRVAAQTAKRQAFTTSATRPAVASKLAKTFYDGEPEGPTVKTPIPGPKSAQIIKDLDPVFDTRNLNMITDFTKSHGNYIADPDGNVLLDV